MINKYTSLMKTPKGAALLIVALLLTGLALFILYMYAVSPAVIRHPRVEHAHARMQLIVDGDRVNFGDDKYQETYVKDVCTDGLTETPIHFHDNKNNFVHLHWKDMGGGMVLKYYGWNLIGGPNDILGYRLDELPEVKKVSIYGNALPAYPKDAQLWIYTGSENSYEKRSEQDFLHQDFETFFDKKSRINAEEEFSWLDALFPRAYAHDGDDQHGVDADNEIEASDEKLERINNLLGDVVVFVQTDEPSESQIKKSFVELEPLGESTCGG